MALGMVSSSGGPVSATSSPRVVQGQVYGGGGAPSAFKSPPVTSPNGFEGSSMLPSRTAPPPPNTYSTQHDTAVPSSPAQGYGASVSRMASGAGYSKSTQNSPNPNRYSAGPASSSLQPMSNGNAAPPQRPTRAGTLPLTDYIIPTNSQPPNSAFLQRDPSNPISPPLQSARSPALTASPNTQSSYSSQPAPPPLQHQPFSAPGNPYAASTGLEKSFEDAKIGLGMGMPMGIADSKDKDLPKEPTTATGRNRSGTGKSSKDKKSMFGVFAG
jgi:hypothetical protein